MAILSSQKRGIFGHLLGVKLILSFLSLFEGILSIKSKNYLFLGSHTKFQPYWTSGQQVMAILSDQKMGIFGHFWV
jgi:hypothetical protein